MIIFHCYVSLPEGIALEKDPGFPFAKLICESWVFHIHLYKWDYWTVNAACALKCRCSYLLLPWTIGFQLSYSWWWSLILFAWWIPIKKDDRWYSSSSHQLVIVSPLQLFFVGFIPTIPSCSSHISIGNGIIPFRRMWRSHCWMEDLLMPRLITKRLVTYSK